MIIDLIDKLADRIIQLLTYRKQMRADLLEKYVLPVFGEFEQVHSAYLESFARYRGLIESSSDPNWIKSLQATLERDNLFSANCRSKEALNNSPHRGALCATTGDRAEI